MNSIIDFYNEHRAPNIELEIRYKNIKYNNFLHLLEKVGGKDITIESFIDIVVYDKDDKIGVRTYYVPDNIRIPFKKTSLKHWNIDSDSGRYTINISDEQEVSLATVKGPISKNSTALFKHRFSKVLDGGDWRIDLTVINKSDTSNQSLRKNKEGFLKINSHQDIINMPDPYKYEYSFEIEYISNHKPLTVEILESVLNLQWGGGDDAVMSTIIPLIAKILEPMNPYLESNKAKALTLKQLLPSPLNLTLQTYANMFPPVGYMLTDKADGYRALVYSNGNSPVYLIYQGRKIIKIDAKTKPLLVDCEYMESLKLCLIFDVMMYDGVNFSATRGGIEERVKFLTKAEDTLNKVTHGEGIRFKAKKYVSLNSPDRYRQNFTDMYSIKNEYKIDGLILVKKGQPYTTTTSYKWKPIENQTIDFYCRKCPPNLYGDYYKQRQGQDLYFLYTGISPQLKVNMKLVDHVGFDQIFTPDEIQAGRTVPIQFTTPVTPFSYLFYYKSENENDLHDKIVELRCTGECIIDNTILNWELMGVRHDKIMIPGREYGNYYITAYDTLLNYMQPFPLESLLFSDKIAETVYFVADKPNIYNAQTSVLNYIKSVIISEYAFETKTVMDIGTGRGADVNKYIQNGIDSLVAVENNKAAVTGLLRRWIDAARKSQVDVRTELTAVIMDFNDSYIDNLTKLKTLVGGVGNVKFNTIFANLSAQYASMSTESIRNFVLLCKEVTEKGSMICFMAPIGERIFDLLGENMEWNSNQDGYNKYSIRKLYTDNTLTPAGQMIEVLLPFSKQEYYQEPLFNVATWTEIMEDEGIQFVKQSNALEYLEGFRVTNRAKFFELTDDDKIYLSLYGVVIYSV